MAFKSEREMLNGFLHQFLIGTDVKTTERVANDAMKSLLIEIFNGVIFGISFVSITSSMSSQKCMMLKLEN